MPQAASYRNTQSNWLSGNPTRGVIYGLIHRVPASGLTVTYDPGRVRVGQTLATSPQGWTTGEYRIAGSTKLFTASKDTYVYVDNTGALQYTAVANGGAKPTQDAAGIGVDSEFICLVVSNGTDVTAITSLANGASHGPIEIMTAVTSFEAAGVGATVNFHTPFAGRILGIDAVEAVAAAGSDTGTITTAIGINDVYTNVTNGVITVGISDAIGTRYSVVPSAAHEFPEGATIRLTTAKTTAGGETNVVLYLEANPLTSS